LFFYKRAHTLWRLLAAKRTFQESKCGSANNGNALDQLLKHPHGERALSIALQEIRKAGLSSRVADLSVCGAVAPYNVLLGGKLVALLMASAETLSLYRGRYSGKPSIISSKMAGRPISRPAELKVLTTTSLYGSGSSQYNRLRLRAADFPELRQNVEWLELAKTEGYGTYHLAPTTMRVLRDVSQQTYGARRINHRFGEGASPRMRQTREALEALGIESDSILHHATPRVFYGCEVHQLAIQELLGLSAPCTSFGPPQSAIAKAWRQRWLRNRIGQSDILARLVNLGPATIKADLLIADDDGQFELVLAAS
jgi:hypothetical protein